MPLEVAAHNKHSAPGQLAGYLFQPERALYHLATAGRGCVVGIETLDDVAIRWTDGKSVREQDKHYVSSKAPLADRSNELWNTLCIWLMAVDAGEIELESTELHLATNREVTTGLALALRDLGENVSLKALRTLANRLRSAGKNPPARFGEQVKTVLAHTDEELMALLGRVRVIDATMASHGEDLRKKIADHLHLPADSADEVMNGLLGWVHDTTLLLIREGKPAWLSSEDFGERYRRELFAHSDSRFFRETAAAEIPVTDREREPLRQNLFVKQLLWIGLAENDDQLIEAIDSVFRGTTETIRLTKKGVVTPSDFADFDNRLLEKWKTVRRAHRVSSDDDVELQRLGQAILNRCMEHREMLAGQATQEWYLTQGAFHKLADALGADLPRLGWHPKYRERCAAATQSPKS